MPDSRVMGLFGDRGSGKSACMAHIGNMKRRAGKNIFYYPPAYGLNIGEPMSPSELAQVPDKLNNAVVLIDEIQELLSKYKQNTIASAQLMSFFRQVRKRGVDVVFTSNDPSNINKHVADQTDFYYRLILKKDPRCHGLGMHIPAEYPGDPRECQDMVIGSAYDAQGRYSDNNHMPLFNTIITHIHRYYHLYDTTSIADPADLLTINKHSLIKNKMYESVGMPRAQLEEKITGVIVNLVNNGFEKIIPGKFAKTLQREQKLTIEPRLLGSMLQEMGLEKNRGPKSVIYTLPDKGELDMWLNGVG